MTLDPDKTVKELDFKIFKSYEDAKTHINFKFTPVEFQGLRPPHTIVIDKYQYKLRTIEYQTPKGTITEQVYILDNVLHKSLGDYLK